MCNGRVGTVITYLMAIFIPETGQVWRSNVRCAIHYTRVIEVQAICSFRKLK